MAVTAGLTLCLLSCSHWREPGVLHVVIMSKSTNALTNQAIAAQRHSGCEVLALRGQYVTPSSVNVPRAPRATSRLNPPLPAHVPIPLYNQSFISEKSDTRYQTGVILDGFKLLEATGMGFPEDGRVANLSDQMITGVVEDDLFFFTGLLMLDVSENKLRLQCFELLPRLKELRIACNSIRYIDAIKGYPRLQVLDLSYNAISMDSLRQLYAIPNLRELDLCGNDLKVLPTDFHRLTYLEKLLLEHNKIEDNFVFDILSKMKNLRELTLAYNSLTDIPVRVTQEGLFR